MRSLLLSIALLPSLAFAWGFDGHKKIASLMQDGMPAGHCLRNWFSSKQTATLQDHACDPDRWKENDDTKPEGEKEWPRHFLDIDYATPVTAYPREFSAVQAWRPQFAFSNGIVPWYVEQKYGELVAAFRAKDEAAILDNAFLLSHYASDSMSILHSTKNFDPNQGPDGLDGLHWRWESQMFFANSHVTGMAAAAQPYIGSAGVADPRNNTFDFVLVGNGLVDGLIAADNASDGGPDSLYTLTKDMTARRWADAIVFISSLLWSAWNDAGRPELNGFPATGCSRAAPMGDPVVNGFPPPGGFTHTPDAGPEDAGVEDGGVDAGPTGGGPGGGGGGGTLPVTGGPWLIGGGQGGGNEEPTGCGCTNVPGAAIAMLGFAALLRRRR
jgi:uncharacterized protein (TIGR03382 family)